MVLEPILDLPFLGLGVGLIALGELVGEIDDEHDPEEAEFIQPAKDTDGKPCFAVRALTRIEDRILPRVSLGLMIATIVLAWSSCSFAQITIEERCKSGR